MTEAGKGNNAGQDVLLRHFGVTEANKLCSRPITVDIVSLVVMCGPITVPLKIKMHSTVASIAEVTDTFLLYLAHPMQFVFRTNEYGFDAHITCAKIFCDASGVRPVFEGANSANQVRIAYPVDCTIHVETNP